MCAREIPDRSIDISNRSIERSIDLCIYLTVEVAVKASRAALKASQENSSKMSAGILTGTRKPASPRPLAASSWIMADSPVFVGSIGNPVTGFLI
jgi:hypothetical protein